MLKTDDIVIVGGGSAGWMSAATLAKAFPDRNVTVIESKDVPTVGVGESTLGSIRRWTRFIGLKEAEFFPACEATVKMSIKFKDFYMKGDEGYHYPFGMPQADGENNPFFDWSIKQYFYPETPISDFVSSTFSQSSLFENNKFSENLTNEFEGFVSGTDVAYHFDATKFGIWLKDSHCLPNGVKHIVGTVTDVVTNEDGIEYLVLDSGDKVYADLFIDCTGFKSLLLGDALKTPFDDSLQRVLPNNRAWATRLQFVDKEKELRGYTECIAINNGWVWNIPLWEKLGTGYVYSDKFITPEDAKEEFKQHLMSDKMLFPKTREEVDALVFKDVPMKVGMYKKTFVKNVVAIGLSAGFIEPLEGNGLFSVHEFLFKLVDILQRGPISQFDRDMYNVACREQFQNFSKFVALHYALSHREDTPYWKALKNQEFGTDETDPYATYRGRDEGYYDIMWRYMLEWGHPFGIPGITWVANGMNLKMLNPSRVQAFTVRTGIDYETYAKDLNARWTRRKARWDKKAAAAPTILEFLTKAYYSDSKE
jgi:tryptophan halogenase